MKIKNLNLYMTILKVVLVAVGVLACLFLFGGPEATADKDVVSKFRDGGAMSFASIFTGFVLFLGVGLILIFFVVQLISNPKKTLLSIVGLVAAFVLFLILWFAGTADTNESLQLRNPVDQGTIVFTTAGLWTAIVATVVAVLAVLAGLFTRAIK